MTFYVKIALFLLTFTLISICNLVVCTTAILKLYSDTSPTPDESSLILETGQSLNRTFVRAPVAVCCNGTWLLYPNEHYSGEATVFGLINPGFCLNTGDKLPNSVQLVGDREDIDTPALTLFPDADYNGVAVSLRGDWGNIFIPFTSYVVTGYYEDGRNEEVTFYDQFGLEGNSICILRRSWVRNITQDFGWAVDSVRSFQYGCP